jgi:peptidoglycan/LPS O-acetylase OafA/YrhL
MLMRTSNDIDGIFSGQTIEGRWLEVKGRSSGFDYLRIILACLIVGWHSYPVAYGPEAALDFWTRWPGLFLQLILPCFFALSGFLVSASKTRVTLSVFLWLRVIRLFPALAVEIILSALILGPLLTQLPLSTYFTTRNFYSYFGNMVGWVHFVLPGVFLDNQIPNVVNASLWTLPFELECYVLISVLVVLGIFTGAGKRMLACLVVVTAIAALINIAMGVNAAPMGTVNGRLLVLNFLAGAVLYSYRARIPYHPGIAVFAAVAGMVLMRFDYLVYLSPILTAYLTVYLGLLNPARTIVVSSGDYSYGTYIYAFPIQQTIASLMHGRATWLSIVSASLPLTIGFSLMSWHFIEKPFQRFKK